MVFLMLFKEKKKIIFNVIFLIFKKIGKIYFNFQKNKLTLDKINKITFKNSNIYKKIKNIM